MSVVVINPYRFAAPSAYLLEENFPTGAAPSGWTISGAWTWNNVTPVMEGTYCAKSQDFGSVLAWKAFTAQSTAYAYFLFQTTDVTPSAAYFLAQLRDSGGTAQASVVVNATSELNIRASGAPGATTVTQLAINTLYHIWFSYTKGTGANASATVAFSTDGVRPTSGNQFASLTNGAATADVERMAILGAGGDNIPDYFDRVLVSASQIGDNP